MEIFPLNSNQKNPINPSNAPRVIRILIADDHTIVRDGIASILGGEPDFEVVGSVGDGYQALELSKKIKPDVILMDLQMPGLNGVETIRKLMVENQSYKIIILTTFDTDEYIFEGIRAGARGYFLKDVPKEELCSAIRSVYLGNSPVQSGLSSKLFNLVAKSGDKPPEISLTERELEIVKLLARGKRNKEIGDLLSLSENTIKGYISILFQKLNVSDRTEAVVYAVQKGLIKLERQG